MPFDRDQYDEIKSDLDSLLGAVASAGRGLKNSFSVDDIADAAQELIPACEALIELARIAYDMAEGQQEE